MYDLSIIEESFQKFMGNLQEFLPEGFTSIDIALLQRYDLLHYHGPAFEGPTLTQYFHVIESYEKIILVNEGFVVWVLPEKNNNISETICLIAINSPGSPRLEVGFRASGIYNSSKLVLRVLDHAISEIVENEALISEYEKYG